MKLISLLAVLMFLVSCTTVKQPESRVGENETIGKNLNANRFATLYFAGQPSSEDYQKLKEQGFKTIINIRHKSEHAESVEMKTVKDLGLYYYNVPFKKKSELTTEYMNRLTATVVKHRKEGKVLVHCSTGNRVGIWLGGHFYKDHGYDKEASIKVAKQLGLKKEEALKLLNKFLAKN